MDYTQGYFYGLSGYPIGLMNRVYSIIDFYGIVLPPLGYDIVLSHWI